MTRDEIVLYARVLMVAHGLESWSFRFDNHKLRFGGCSYQGKYLTLSWPVARINSDAEVMNTIKHEIAHALTPHAEHGPVWKLQAMLIGARPEACVSSQSIVTVPGRWQGQCGCSRVNNRYRAPKPGAKYRCQLCGVSFTFVDTRQAV